MSKPRPDDKLTPHRDELFPRMKQGESYHRLRTWLREEQDVETSLAALSNAWKKWIREDLEERALKSKGVADDVIELIDEPGKLDAALTLALKQSAFEMAMNGGDPKSIKSFCTILHKGRQLDFEVEKAMSQLKSSQNKALDLLFEDIQGNPEAEKLFSKMRDVLTAATEDATHG